MERNVSESGLSSRLDLVETIARESRTHAEFEIRQILLKAACMLLESQLWPCDALPMQGFNAGARVNRTDSESAETIA